MSNGLSDQSICLGGEDQLHFLVEDDTTGSEKAQVRGITVVNKDRPDNKYKQPNITSRDGTKGQVREHSHLSRFNSGKGNHVTGQDIISNIESAFRV